MHGMYWDDFRRFIERNKRTWARLRYYRSKDGFKDTISICDFTLPKREGHVQTGHEQDDWYRDSFVCNCGYLEGYVPYANNPSVWNEEEYKWEVYPMRGVRETAKSLLAQRVLRETAEVKDLIEHARIPPLS